MAILTTNGIFFSAGNELNSRRQLFPTSTVWSYFQAAAPTGWTKIITQDNKALRVVSGTGAGSGGTTNFTTVFSPTVALTGTITAPTSGIQPGPALATSQIPSHIHSNGGEVSLTINPQNPDGSYTGGDVRAGSGWSRNSPATGSGGSSSTHTHPFTGSGPIGSLGLSVGVQYIDIIMCSFDG